MYQPDRRDKIVELESFPQSSVGVPIPIVLGDEHSVAVAYYLEDTPDDWDGTNVRVVDANTSQEPLAIIHFTSCRAYMAGPPNDEAFGGHPLASRGLEPYGAFEVHESSWLRSLEKMNSVHPYHSPKLFHDLRHIILTFHDSIFECITSNFQIHQSAGSLSSAVSLMQQLVLGKQ